VDQCLAQIGTVPQDTNVGFLYLTDVLADLTDAVMQRLRDKTGVEHWVGTVGMGICATGLEYYDSAAVAVMLARLPDDSFRILPFYNRAADHLPGDWPAWLTSSTSHVGLVHGDPGNGNLPVLLDQLAAELPGGYLVGGLSSSHGTHPQIADQVTEGGLSGIVFNDRVAVYTAVSQGCSPIAEKHRITDCEHNIINSLDDQPALDVLKQDVGEILARDLNRLAGYIFVGLPVQESDTDDYLVRNLIGIDVPGKRIAIGDIVTNGHKLQFCRRDGTTAWEDLKRMLDSLKARLPGPPRGGIYCSCVGRGRELFGPDSEELQLIRKELGDFPLVGFFANGEIAGQRLYGYTGVLTIFQ
jgi:small ligand-binding sensory domain FIST